MNTQEKVFEWQYSWEKILLRVHPHPVFFFLQKLPSLAGIIFLSIILLISLYFLSEYRLIIGLILLVLIIALLFGIRWLYHGQKYTITSRRCIYYIQKNFFKKWYNEIHLVDLRTAIPKKSGIFGKIFGYGTLILTDKDEKKIVYTWIAEHIYLSRYLGRIIDYIKIHWHTDDISVYQPRKEREESKKQSTGV